MLLFALQIFTDFSVVVKPNTVSLVQEFTVLPQGTPQSMAR